jgi:hypothetical protein
MRSRLLALAAATAVMLPLMADPGRASLTPSSLTLRAGAALGVGVAGMDWSVAPALSAAWRTGRRTALWASASYMRETVHSPILGYTTSSGPSWPTPVYGGDRTTHYLPLAAGLRAFASDSDGRPRGAYIEGGPACVIARTWSEDGRRRTVALAGLEAGTGVRLPSTPGSHGEIGLSYYLAMGPGRLDSGGCSRCGNRPPLSAFALYVALGLGD